MHSACARHRLSIRVICNQRTSTMSDEKKTPETPASEPETETRVVTVTISGRMPRRAGDALLAACKTIGDAFMARGISLTIAASAPVATSDGKPEDEDAGPCECPVCTIKRAIVAAMGADASETSPDSAARAQAERDAGVNAIPAKGPWGVS